MIRYKGAKIQLLDLPGIIEGAKDGKGRGRQVSTGSRLNCKYITTSSHRVLLSTVLGIQRSAWVAQ